MCVCGHQHYYDCPCGCTMYEHDDGTDGALSHAPYSWSNTPKMDWKKPEGKFQPPDSAPISGLRSWFRW